MSASIYAGNLQRTGEYQTRGLRTLQGVRWSFQTQGHIHFPPLVAHGIVYVGSNDGCFYALGTHTGALQWRFEKEKSLVPLFWTEMSQHATLELISIYPHSLEKRNK